MAAKWREQVILTDGSGPDETKKEALLTSGNKVKHTEDSSTQ